MFLVPFLPLMATTMTVFQWPLPRITNYSGDIMIGALFPIHERNSKFECGHVQVSEVRSESVTALR